ncbi:MAG: hypothetical protein NT075_31430 [Chloroflexi bacterium]|nr:hypothetical protein [Chloroflexota bacterium]
MIEKNISRHFVKAGGWGQELGSRLFVFRFHIGKITQIHPCWQIGAYHDMACAVWYIEGHRDAY